MTALILALALHRMRLRATLRRTLAALTDYWRHVSTRRQRAEARLYEWPAMLWAAGDGDRGHCRVCGEEHALKQDGRVRRHGPCLGGDELPAQTLMAGAT